MGFRGKFVEIDLSVGSCSNRCIRTAIIPNTAEIRHFFCHTTTKVYNIIQHTIMVA